MLLFSPTDQKANGHGHAATERPLTRAGQHVDFTLHDLLSIRLINATAADTAAVIRQLGLQPAAFAGAPDITVRFVPKLAVHGTMRYLGLNNAAFTETQFFVLAGKHGSEPEAEIPFERIGSSSAIICRNGVRSVPLLIPIVNYTALAKGLAPIHASAFEYNGLGVLAAGWSKGGKTEALLSFMACGASYAGDDWLYVPPDGRRMYGLPEPVRLQDWHLQDLPKFRQCVRRGARLQLKALGMLCWIIRCARSVLSEGRVQRALGRASALLDRQRFVTVDPERLFRRQFASQPTSIDRVLWMVSHDAPHITVDRVDARDIAQRMVYSNQHERLRFMAYYLSFCFAFPQLKNPLIDGAEQRQCELLERALSGKQAYVVAHPYPVRIPALFEALAPRFERDRNAEVESMDNARTEPYARAQN